MYNDQKLNLKAIFLSFYFGPFSMSPHRAHSWVVEFQSQNIGHNDTRLSTYSVFNALCYIPCLQFPTIAVYRSFSSTSLLSFHYTATAANALAHARPNTSCSHHILGTYTPGLHTFFSHRFIIFCVTTYCVNIFCLLRT